MAARKCPRCGGLYSPTTEHTCQVQLHPAVIAHLQRARTIPIYDHDDPLVRELEEWWALDLDAPLDAHLDRRS